jgi:hypothetical protein
MDDGKNSVASRWQRQPPLKTNFYLCFTNEKLEHMFNPLFPLQRANLLLLCWVNLFPSILSKHLSYCVSIIHMLIYSILFPVFLCLVWCFYLREYMFESYLWLWRDCYDWACGFCYISSDIKGSNRNISVICSLFSDQEQRFAITNHDLPCASLLWFPLLIASQVIWREIAIYYDLCLGKCDACCPYFVYRHFTP